MLERRAWMAWSGAVAAASVVYFALLEEPWRSVLYDLVAFGAAVAIVAGTLAHRPAAPLGWWLLAGGIASWAIGDAMWTAHDFTTDEPVPFPSPADAVYLVGYFLIGAAVASLCRARGITRRTVADSVVLGLSLGGLAIGPVVVDVVDADAGLLTELFSVAYPVMTWLTLLAAVCLATSGGFRQPAARLLAGGLAVELVTDVVYAHQGLDGTYVSGSAIDAGWLAFYLAVGAAALHPTMADVGVPQHSNHLTIPRLAVIAAALVPLVAESALDGVSDVVATPFWVLVFVLVVWRLADLVGGLSRAALRDSLTGLPNRTALTERLDLALAMARRRGRIVAVLFCDVDRLKTVNDNLGHAAGDEVLRRIAERLVASVRESDTVARLGGDEFVVLIPDAADAGEVEVAAERIHDALKAPITVDNGSEFVATMSIGVRTGGTDDPDAGVDEMLREADTAMYLAKDRGRNQIVRSRPQGAS